jgi:S-DNA-T family DNA segregation ATPase FtsK/SpoIIIE
MKPPRLVSTPTRNRRLNELLGLTLLVASALLLLALATYHPGDPSLDTAGGVLPAQSTHLAARLASDRGAQNWTGLAGAWIADLMLQTIGIAAFLLPLVLARIGLCWIRQRNAGSAKARVVGLTLWVIFAPAAVGLIPRRIVWHNALPIEGVTGRLLADAMVSYLNLPGATIVLALMVSVSLYLATTFTFQNAREWSESHLAWVHRLIARIQTRRDRRALIAAAKRHDEETTEISSSRESSSLAEAAQALARERNLAARESSTLLGSLFAWWARLRGRQITPAAQDAGRLGADPAAPASVWQAMPRTLVDAPPVTPLSTAGAAAAPYAEALAAAAAPSRADVDFAGQPALELPQAPPARTPRRRGIDTMDATLETASVSERAPVPSTVAVAAPVATAPAAPPAADGISFGKRADADIKPVTITPKSIRGYKLPPSSLLYRSEEQAAVREDALREEARILVEKCGEFGVDGQVTQINPGPVVTTFEFRPDAGVKYSRVTGLADDLCLAMAAESILIERMAGKSTVGIQVPNHERETIWLRDVVECESFAQSKSRLAIALGKDINGRIVTADLAAMPHVLIAGSTGSGKSVAINAMIMSVLFKSTPEQVRMILVDPKRVELGMYEGIPHLFTPIITEAKLAANALRNAVKEMERRLKLLAANHVRNIDQFNKLFDHGSEYLFEDVNQEPLPYIIIIIDELADLMMLDRANVEESITRLAQMARAVGIHLVLATQRPSVDVITGLIKANVPTRMSFRLATKVDSRTIIDSNGAESLLGRGDMLYLPPGTSRVQRVHAPFVTEKEISAVTEFWKAQGEAEYVQSFLEGPKDESAKDGGDGDTSADDNDPLFDDAVRLVFEFGKASTSLLQRRLRIGYGRAAHLIDLMEKDGLVGPADGSKPREILKAPSYYSEVDSALR